MADRYQKHTAELVSIVVPVYRSAKILPRLVEELKAALLPAEGKTDSFELLLVCDASPDNSWSVIQALSMQHAFVRGIHLRINAGQHNAIMVGLRCARGRRIVIMDDDLQHPPTAIPLLLRALDDGFDVCYTRYHHRRHSWWKKVGSKINDVAATLLLQKPKGLYLSSFKALDAAVAREVVKYDGPYAYVDGLILDVTRRITSVEIEHRPRAEGKGNYDLRRSLSLWLKMATSFSVFPLRLLSIAGACLALFSLSMMAYVIALKIADPTIAAGWTSLMATILLLGGLQMLGLGMIGEYLGRVYLKLNRKPQFVIRETTFTKECSTDAPYSAEFAARHRLHSRQTIV
ncbi:MAG: glycosyltransferase family 2 protein [Deltaproteobacteria bacterium]|nr:glycosyltransferase family 2 protein [Deltaproteobacteria bacterium]